MFPNLTTLALLWVAGSLIFIPLMIIAVRLEQRVGQLSRELERMAAGGAPHTGP